MCCPPKYWQNTTADTLTNDLNRRKCRTLASLWFLRWGLLIKDMSKVITFLVGFYVSPIVRRWWEQIKYLPLPVATNIQLANIIE